MRFCERLEQLGACEEAQKWVGRHGMKWAYENCEHPGWMMWALGRIYNWRDYFSLCGELQERYKSLRGCVLSHYMGRHVHACNYIRKHVTLGELPELTAQCEVNANDHPG